jgi:dihydroflavonol-4-reductase
MALSPTFFITGGFGFLGQHIVQAVATLHPNAEIRVQARSQRALVVPIDRLPNVHIFRADLLDPTAFAGQLDGVETVIHNAAVVSFKKSDREKIIDSNINSTRELLKLSAEKGVKNFIFISSISAVQTAPPRVSDESMYPDLEYKKRIDAYGYSKMMGEIEALKYREQMQVLILNPSVILGPGSTQIARVIPWLRHLPIIPMLPTINSFVDVRDVANAVLHVMERGVSGERYIITSENINMVDFLQLAVDVMGRRTRIVPVSTGLVKIGDALVDLLDKLRINPGIRRISDINVDKAYFNLKAREKLGWTPTFTLEETLRATLNLD